MGLSVDTKQKLAALKTHLDEFRISNMGMNATDLPKPPMSRKAPEYLRWLGEQKQFYRESIVYSIYKARAENACKKIAEIINGTPWSSNKFSRSTIVKRVFSAKKYAELLTISNPGMTSLGRILPVGGVNAKWIIKAAAAVLTPFLVAGAFMFGNNKADPKNLI